MAEVQEQDESADSRTAVLGQKRGYQDSTVSLSLAAAGRDSSTDEESMQRSEKRAKLDLDISHEPLPDDGVVDGVISSQAASTKEAPTLPTTLPATLPPTIVWNKGIQSGLRTSFAGKFKAKISPLASHRPTVIAEGSESVLPPWGPTGRTDTEEADSGSDSEHFSDESETQEDLSMDGNSLHTNSSTSLPALPLVVSKKLTKSMKKKMSQEEITRYRSAYKTFLRTEDKTVATRQAEELFRLKPYPLPRGYGELKSKLRAGRTFYPTPGPSLKKRKFRIDELELALYPVLGNGKPILVQNFGYHLFVPQLLENNQQHWESLTDPIVLKCFDAYMRMYYRHVPEFHQPMRDAAEAENYISIEEAIQVVNHKPDSPDAAQNTSPRHTRNRDEPSPGHAILKLLKEPRAASHTTSQAASFYSPGIVGEPLLRGTRIRGASMEPGVPYDFHARSQSARRGDAESLLVGVVSDSSQQENFLSPLRGVLVAGSSAQLNTHSTDATPAQNTINATGDVPIANGLNTRHVISYSAVYSPTSGIAPEPILALLRADSEMDGVAFTATELGLQGKYFPATDGQLVGHRCLACADSGHSPSNCPALICTLCGVVGNHSSFTCPQRRKCGKCRKPGHQRSECREKLLPAKSELLGCEVCTATDHTEESCHLIWRSYDPKPEDIKVVQSIPVHCYSCGASGHYGPVCGLQPAGRILSGGFTWSEANLRRYVDVKTSERAVSAGIDYSIQPSLTRPRRSLSIKGRANNPITLDDSDDDRENFIRPKVDQPGARHRNIQFSTHNRPGHESKGPPQHLPSRLPMLRGPVESTTNAQERSFSPPPTFNHFHRENTENDRRHRPDSPAGWGDEYSYRPAGMASYAYPPQPQTSSVKGNSVRGGHIQSNSNRGGRGGAPGRGAGQDISNVAKGGSAAPKGGKSAGKGNGNAPKGNSNPSMGRGDNKRKPRMTKKERARMANEKAAKGARGH